MALRMRIHFLRILFVIVNRSNHVFSIKNNGNNIDNTVTVFKNPRIHVPGGKIEIIKLGIIKIKLEA